MLREALTHRTLQCRRQLPEGFFLLLLGSRHEVSQAQIIGLSVAVSVSASFCSFSRVFGARRPFTATMWPDVAHRDKPYT